MDVQTLPKFPKNYNFLKIIFKILEEIFLFEEKWTGRNLDFELLRLRFKNVKVNSSIILFKNCNSQQINLFIFIIMISIKFEKNYEK